MSTANAVDSVTVTSVGSDYSLDDTVTVNTNYMGASGGYVSGYGPTPPVGKNITISSNSIGSLSNSGQVYISGANGTAWVNQPNTASVKIGNDFEIVATSDGSGPTKLKYKDQEIEVGQLFSMVNVFKVLLKSVADDPKFCERHPEIRDLAYQYLIEELKR
jgi:hypothetical protein